MHRGVITQDLGKGAKSLVLFLIDLGRIGNEGKNMRFGQFVRKNLKAGQLRPFLRRMNGALRNNPTFLRIEPYPAKSVSDDVAINWLRGMTRPPTDDITP